MEVTGLIYHRWTAGYVIGREIMPQEVDTTNRLHASMKSFSGNQLSIANGTASEVFVTQMLDETVSYELPEIFCKQAG